MSVVDKPCRVESAHILEHSERKERHGINGGKVCFRFDTELPSIDAAECDTALVLVIV